MIVRVLGQGQWVLEIDDMETLNVLDAELEQAVEAEDAEALKSVLERLFDMVQELGTIVPDDVIVESDLVLPDSDATIEEVRLLIESTTEHFGIFPDVPSQADKQESEEN